LQYCKPDPLHSIEEINDNRPDVDLKDEDDLPLLSSALNGKAELFVTKD
jgi:predicted nucleic acid-binding protein